MRNTGLEETQAGTKIAGLQICRWHHPYDRKWRRTKEPLDESARGEWKSWLLSSTFRKQIMASGPITSWQPDGETVSDFIFLGSEITADGGCSHEIKRRLLLGRKVMTNLDSILKSRDITLSTKVRLVKAMVFPVVTYVCLFLLRDLTHLSLLPASLLLSSPLYTLVELVLCYSKNSLSMYLSQCFIIFSTYNIYVPFSH